MKLQAVVNMTVNLWALQMTKSFLQAESCGLASE
jgi:hypothetical protein